jgi:glutathione peroxidase
MFSKFLLPVIIGIPSWFISCFNSGKVSSVPENKKTETTMQTTPFYSLNAVSLDGETINMESYKGKKIIVLNVASKCGYTSQYADWQAFYEKNADRYVVLGFPCNQFMSQEPGSAEEIGAFCQKNYGVSFPMFDKVDVKGENQSPVYKWLTDPALNGWNSDVPSWNFCKYLIDENGRLTHFFASKIKPDSPEFLAAIQ